MTNTIPTITAELVDGTKVVVPDCLDQLTPYVLQEQGDWFEDEIRLLRRRIQPGQTVVDIGANFGVYSLSLARRVGPGGRVWAFEPVSSMANLLAESIVVNGTNWVCLETKAILALANEAAGATTLDACLEGLGWQEVDLLKIDAEGEEETILAGGQRFFQELSPLVMFRLRDGANLRLDLVEQFAELGYRCFRLVPALDALMPFDPRAGVDGYLLNLFAAKPDRIASLAAQGWLVETAQPASPDTSELEPYQWQKSLGDLPYVQALSPGWNRQDPTESGHTVCDALAYWAFSSDRDQPLELRLGALQQSLELLQSVTSQQAPIPRWSSLARVALDLGDRSLALRAMGHLIPALEEGVATDLGEPFLPPIARYDTIEPKEDLAIWLQSAALETEELKGSYSSYFTRDTARPRLEKLLALGFAGADVLARLRLIENRFPKAVAASADLALQDPAQIARSKQAYELIHRGQAERGMALLREARQMGDCCAKALHYIGKALLMLGNSAEGIAALQRAVELDPSNTAALVELGIGLKSSGEGEAAQAVLQQAIFLYGYLFSSEEPTSIDLTNLGIAFDELGEKEQALESLNRALALDPKAENALLRKASILVDRKEGHDEAMAIWRGILAKNPDHLGSVSNCANLLITYGELPEAIRLLEQCLESAPSNRGLHHLLAFAHSISGTAAVGAHLRHLRSYWQEVRNSASEKDGPSIGFTLPNMRGKTRIGFLSAELGDHVVSLFLEPFLEHYDRERFEVELIEVKEHHTRRGNSLRKLADAVVTVQGLTLDDARQRLRARRYHVIVETSGFTANSGIEILAERCAPVQCHYVGFHASTGLDTMDWFIGDELTAAEDLADQYVERLWPLPRPWLASRRLTDEMPDPQARVDGPIPVLGSFSQFGKVGPQTIRFWARALHQLPEAVLHLKNYSTDSDVPQRRILENMVNEGIDPERVTFLPRTSSWREHMECYEAIDLALDTTPWSGATTAFEALSMGVPVVGIHGSTTASRMSCSILQALGKGAWIASTPEVFAQAVEQIVSDLPRLRGSRLALRQQVLNSSLFDGADLARHLQEAFEAMVRDRTHGGRQGQEQPEGARRRRLHSQ